MVCVCVRLPGCCGQCYGSGCCGFLQLLAFLLVCELLLGGGARLLFGLEPLLQLAHCLFVLLLGLHGIMEPARTQQPQDKEQHVSQQEITGVTEDSLLPGVSV